MDTFQSYAIGKSKSNARKILEALAHTNCDQRFRIARGLSFILRIEAETSAIIPPHAKQIIQDLEAEIEPYNHLNCDEPMDRFYHYLKKYKSSRQREAITDKIISASIDILTQKEI